MENYISKEQFYKLAHIRKSTALALIQSGLVPAIDNGKETCRYQIKMSDVEFYLKDRVEHPEKYRLIHGNLTQCFPEPYRRDKARSLRIIARILWKDEPDLLTISEAANLLGYRPATLMTWKKRGWLTVVSTVNRIYIPKKFLLDFVQRQEFHELRMKSEKHRALIGRLKQNEA